LPQCRGIRAHTPVSPHTPALLLLLQTLSSLYLELNAAYYPKKRTIFASSKLLHLFSTSNFVVFVDGVRKNISFSRAHGTLATPLAQGHNKQTCRLVYTHLLLNVKQESCKCKLFKPLAWLNEGIVLTRNNYEANAF